MRLNFPKFLFSFILITHSLCGYTEHQPMIKREQVKPMTTSVVIPCVPKHFQYIFQLLTYYSEQSVPPDEIVISLSEAWRVDHVALAAVKTHSWPFKFKIICHREKKSEGENLNIAAAASSGDIILGQSADDIPHPQRVEVVKYLFENYYIDHLMHTLSHPNEPFSPYSIDNLETYYFLTYLQEINNRAIHNGVVCLTRETASKVKWVEGFREGTDTDFNKKIYSKIKYKAILYNPLMLYRIALSTYTGINREG